MKILNPIFGKKRIADLLCRAGLVIATSTIGRMLKSNQRPTDELSLDLIEEESASTFESKINADYPNHIWNVDLTVVPTTGLWTSWLSNTFFQCWPFAYYVAAVIDHYTRRVIGFAVFKKQPPSLEVQNFLKRAIAKEGQNPRYIISDKGSQFWCKSYNSWAEDSGVKLRFGAIGQHGSIAVIERFFKTLKEEFLSQTKVLKNLAEFRQELAAIIEYYNEYRPHAFLNGQTPNEATLDKTPEILKFEPRKAMQKESCKAENNTQPCSSLKLCVRYHAAFSENSLILSRS